MNEVKQYSATDKTQAISLRPGEKYNLTVKEAASYFSIGEKKIRKIADDNPDADFILMNGSHMLIKRGAFERYIDAAYSV